MVIEYPISAGSQQRLHCSKGYFSKCSEVDCTVFGEI